MHLQQVLLNLVLNAMDAMPSGHTGERRVILRAQPSGPAAVQLSVSDNGSGLPPEKTADIFEPFFTTKSNGMGMGLPISRTIIEAHGGKLKAENNADRRGATFHFTLRAAAEGGAA